MKSMTKYIGILAALLLFAACDLQDYPDRFRATSGVPSIDFVRYADRDVFITQAYMDEVLCVVGSNLCSVHEVYFNDQPAILNTSYITDHTLLVSVPSKAATEKTDKIYFKTASGDVVTYDFKVLPPAPKINAMSNEWAKPGETVTMSGRYFIDVTGVQMPGVEVTEYTVDSGESITFTVPEGANPGPVEVYTASGSGRSSFQYKDSRNMLFDWDGTYGMALGYGWRAGDKVLCAPGTHAFPALDGNYIAFSSDFDGTPYGAWAEDPCSFDYWPGEVGSAHAPLYSFDTFSQYINKYGVGGLCLKFEILVPTSNPWTGVALQLMFSSENQVSESDMNNNYFSDDDFPRAVWEPWIATGSFDTGDKWQTVSIPLTDFNKKSNGSACATKFDDSYLHGLAFFVWGGSAEGKAGTPIIAIDNIRVVPL